MSSVKIVRDRNNPSVFVPDVYRKYLLRHKRKIQLEHLSIADGSKHSGTSQQQQHSLLGQKKEFISGRGFNITRSSTNNKNMKYITGDMFAEDSKSTTGLKSSRKSVIRKKAAMTKKFQPVLEPLVELI